MFIPPLDRSDRFQGIDQNVKNSQLYISPLRHVKRLLSSTNASHIITLMDVSWNILTPENISPDNHLKLVLNDAHNEKPGVIAPNKSHITKLIKFISDWDQQNPMIIHCLAGISRSTAAAYITQCVLNPKTDEIYLANLMRNASETAYPNMQMITLADKILKRRGRMIHAIKGIGRGIKSNSGKVFILPAVDP